ncbi:MAG: tetratricopeptide repeat protein [Flavitalea sp.]
MKIYYFFILIFGLIVSCREDEPKQEIISAEVLNQPPYAGITDSIKLDPENIELRLTRALMLSQNSLHELATPDFQKAWEQTKNASIGLEYASNLFLSGNEREALKFLEDGTKLFPDDLDYQRRLAEVYKEIGHKEKAFNVYNKLLAKDSSDFEGWYNLGTIQAENGDTSAAILSLERSFSIMPLNHSGLYLANILINKKDPKALKLIDFVIERDSAQILTDALFLKGVYYSETNQPQKAIEQYDAVIKRDWKVTDAHIEKGIIYLKQKDFKKAIEIFTLASTVSNTDADPYFWLGRTYEAQAKNNLAIDNYQRALSLDPGFVEARQRLDKLEDQN